ncbi:HAMP domain-containing sensor histidine kinase [Leptotrichia sp. oral taxon 879]|uniref:HAMP domain-containing sensor histidine kinase n=1 Tax=Leptotrichia sp. oral taxon 879 TaxID=1227267 RepID=UPI0003ADCA0C|nr:HAMP domain-containing sensor histidine kinase [Leptotrichia sp. oral taxon 879]ERK49715.1 ATPase/histidine kinase/DNA gyrase B/HSP90 domain protein [Leptotrichia sp. oral taxon 879 str. F0557]
MNKNTSNNFVNKINNKKRISIKTKIALWYTSMIIIIVLCFLGTMFYISSIAVKNSVYKRLKTTVEKINKSIELENGELIIDNNLSVITDDIFISIYDKNLNFIYGNTDIDLEVSQNSDESNKVKIVKQKNSNSKWYVYDIRKNFIEHGEILIRGITPFSSLEKNIELIILIFIIIFPFLIIVSILSGKFITKKSFSPIEQIVKTVNKISRGDDLSQRINLQSGEREIYDLAETFDQMFNRLQEAFDREAQFTSDVAHELRTPLSAIRMQSEYSLKYLNLNEESEDILKNILEKSKKMSTLISQLLMLARMDKKNQKLNIKNENLNEIIQLVIEVESNYAKEKNIKIIYDEKNDIFADVDKDMLTRVFINLISNAITYGNENGTIKIILNKIENESENTDVQKSKIKCQIIDDGIGISSEHINKIWNRFYQVESSRSTDNSGLGLSIVKWIIEEHKGTIMVESELGKGTIFTFYLPEKIL